ncbi:hypothetical protein D3C81_1681020 [compost metagenome]
MQGKTARFQLIGMQGGQRLGRQALHIGRVVSQVQGPLQARHVRQVGQVGHGRERGEKVGETRAKLIQIGAIGWHLPAIRARQSGKECLAHQRQHDGIDVA